MIIARAPFRLSFGGGGSDLPAFYRRWGGSVLSASVNKYMYINVHPSFDKDRILLKYSRTEDVRSHDEIHHRIFKTVLRRFGLYGIEITSIADIPSGTGLGSSSSFTVALLQCLYAYRREFRSKMDIAAEACRIEIEELGSPIGKQDQYAAAFGGLNFLTFHPDDSVTVEPVVLGHDGLERLTSHLALFYTGLIRDANPILATESASLAGGGAAAAAMRRMVAVAGEMRVALERGAFDDFGALLDEQWQLKRSLADGISTAALDAIYCRGRAAGALGGKLLGAGGGGFMLFYCPPERQPALREALADLRPFPVRLESGGVQVIFFEP